MKTYLTDKEFADLFFKLHDRAMTSNYDATGADRIIHSMFCEYDTEVKETLEGAMWNIDEFTGDKAIDLIGYQFHKSFRQVDVIPARHIDSILWICMQDAPVFWKVLEKACKILVSKEAAEIYKDEVVL